MASAIRNYLYNKASSLRSWRYRRSGMTIGQGCKISSSAKLDKTHPSGIVIGDYTAVSFRTSVLTHDFLNGRHLDTRIGSNCFIGACSVIMPGVSVGDNAIVGTGSVVFTDVPPNSVVSGNPARIVETGIVTGKWGIRNPKFLELEGIAVNGKVNGKMNGGSAAIAAPASAAATSAKSPAMGSRGALESYFPDLALDRPFSDSGWDSFALITLRAEIEENEAIQIADEEWLAVERPLDLRRYVTKPKAGAHVSEHKAATARRVVEINMPQMSMKGLSESWLYKEMGDIHWSLITGALGVKSNAIADQDGARLYATFTRIRYRSDSALAEFRENEQLEFDAAMTRFGAGMFFSRVSAASPAGTARFELMSSFSKFGEEGNNRSLLKGQPAIPPDFIIPSIAELPEFAQQYRATRAEPVAPAIFSTDYEIVPIHDINGVGLLYFAAYPVITDICTQRFVGKDVRISPIERDVNYFANSGSNEAIRFVLTEWDANDGTAAASGNFSRADETRMATVRTRYRLY